MVGRTATSVLEPALRVEFGPGDVAVTADDEARLTALASRVAGGQVSVLTVTGYAERSGDAVLERQLALGRAQAVAQVLLDAGVPAGALRVDGAGATGGAGRFVLVTEG